MGIDRRWKIVGMGIILPVLLTLVALIALSGRHGVLGKTQLADGRILQIEGMTYGTNHRIGTRNLMNQLPWIPRKVRQMFTPKQPETRMDLDQPGLVVWVNALDLKTGKFVDCQGVRLEFVDEQGDLFGDADKTCQGFGEFWRVGHAFYAFPRDQRRLTLQITPYNSNVSSHIELDNSFFVESASWSGKPLPQQKRVGELEVIMTEMILRTNGGPDKYWETPGRYFEPVWELRRNGKFVDGWSKPEWIAEDSTGNRSQYLGIHRPVLRFSATVYPDVTNEQAVVTVATLPKTALGATNWWNMEVSYEGQKISVLGLLPPGRHVFRSGVFDTNPPPMALSVSGGAPSGWLGKSLVVAPGVRKTWNGHYTPNPVIYVRAPALSAEARLAVRLRDETGRCWVAEPEPQGTQQEITPFLVKVPDDVKSVVAEVVVLKPISASFDVDMKAYQRP